MKYFKIYDSGGTVRSDDTWHEQVYLPKTFQPCHCPLRHGVYPTANVVLERGEVIRGAINGIWWTCICCCRLDVLDAMHRMGMKFIEGTVTTSRGASRAYRSIIPTFDCLVQRQWGDQKLKTCTCGWIYPEAEMSKGEKIYFRRDEIGSRLAFADENGGGYYFREDLVPEIERLGIKLAEIKVV